MNSKEQLIKLINERKVVKTEAVTTSAGEQTKVYLDIPGVLGDTTALGVATEALFEHLVAHGVYQSSTMVVGPMTGSIPLVMGLASHDLVAADYEWSIIRDQVKDHGLGRAFVGAEPGPGDKVILVDDVASSGKSLMQAGIRVAQTGAEVIAIVPLVDRGEQAGELFAKDGILYLPVLTYKDLGIEAL